MHWPVAGSREFAGACTRPNSTTRVRTGATIGICSVRRSGTWLLSLRAAAVGRGQRVRPGTSTLCTRAHDPELQHGAEHRIVGVARAGLAPASRPPSGLLPLVCFKMSTRCSLSPMRNLEKSTTMS